MIVWDLDNTLVHTREASLAAYRSIGLNPPENFHVQHWSSWCTHEQHNKKNSVIAGFIDTWATLTPLAGVYQSDKHFILTNSSRSMVGAVMRKFPEVFWNHSNILCDLTIDLKLEWLARNSEPGVYADDSWLTIDRVRSETTNWGTMWVQW